jgi:hypothetical protein
MARCPRLRQSFALPPPGDGALSLAQAELRPTRTPSFFPVVVVYDVRADCCPFGRAYDPFLAIRKIVGLTERIIRHHIEDQILLAVVDELVGLARLKEKSVACFDGAGSIRVTDHSRARNHKVKLPLGAMGVIGIRAFARGNPQYLNVKGMSFPQIGRGRVTPERFGDFLARADKLSFGR